MLVSSAPSPSLPRRSGKGRGLLRKLVTLAVVAGVGYGLWAFAGPRLWGGSGKARPLTAVAVRGEIKIGITDTGELESIDAVQVMCELMGGGKLVSVVDEGKVVAKGDEVARLDTDVLAKLLSEQEVKWQTADGKVKSCRSDLSQALNKKEGEIAKVELALTLAKIDLEAYTDEKGECRKEIDDRKGKLELAKKQRKEGEDDLAFTRDLVKDGYAQLEQLRAKEFTVEQRKFEVASAEADLAIFERFTKLKKVTELKAKSEDAAREVVRTKETQQSLVEKAESELKAAESNADIEKKQLARLNEQIDRCTIRAPAGGIVVYSTARSWDENARIRPGAQVYFRQPILSLPDLSKMRVKMKIHESVVKKVNASMDATLQISALPDKTLHGKVIKIATIAQSDGWRGSGVKQYETTVSIADLPSDAGLKPGMTADVKILIAVLPDAISVPVTAVTEFDGKKVVYAVVGNTVTRREVKVGETNEQFVQVLEGVAPGEEVALDARQRASVESKASGPAAKGAKPETPPSAPTAAAPLSAGGG